MNLPPSLIVWVFILIGVEIVLETLRNRIRDITDDYPIRSVLACVLVGVVVGALL